MRPCGRRRLRGAAEAATVSGTVQEHGELLAQQLAAARATQVEATREAEAARVEPAGLREAFVEAQARAAVVAEVVVVEVEAAAEAAAEAAGTREDEAEVQAEVAAGAAAKHQAVNVARCAAAERARLEAMAWAGAEERARGLEAMLVAVQAGARASDARRRWRRRSPRGGSSRGGGGGGVARRAGGGGSDGGGSAHEPELIPEGKRVTRMAS